MLGLGTGNADWQCFRYALEGATRVLWQCRHYRLEREGRALSDESLLALALAPAGTWRPLDLSQLAQHDRVEFRQRVQHPVGDQEIRMRPQRLVGHSHALHLRRLGGEYAIRRILEG